MSRYLPIILTASIAVGFSACETTDPQTTIKQRPIGSSGTTGSSHPQSAVTPAPTPKVTTEEPISASGSTPPVAVEPRPTPIPTPVPEDYPTATNVDGKPGYVKSPSGPGIIDVRGYPPGTEVKDPYTGKIFLVP